jgi:BMFP domain-containing protein YqiC
MASRSEYDAAYFTLLRAREEHAQLLSYREYLVAELDRLDNFATQLREQAEELPRRMRRPIDQTAKVVLEAVGTRRAVVLSELERMDERIANAQTFVEECEVEVAQLRDDH